MIRFSFPTTMLPAVCSPIVPGLTASCVDELAPNTVDAEMIACSEPGRDLTFQYCVAETSQIAHSPNRLMLMGLWLEEDPILGLEGLSDDEVMRVWKKISAELDDEASCDGSTGCECSEDEVERLICGALGFVASIGRIKESRVVSLWAKKDLQTAKFIHRYLNGIAAVSFLGGTFRYNDQNSFEQGRFVELLLSASLPGVTFKGAGDARVAVFSDGTHVLLSFALERADGIRSSYEGMLSFHRRAEAERREMYTSVNDDIDVDLTPIARALKTDIEGARIFVDRHRSGFERFSSWYMLESSSFVYDEALMEFALAVKGGHFI